MMKMILVYTSISFVPHYFTTVCIIGNKTGVIFWDYGDSKFGICKETI